MPKVQDFHNLSEGSILRVVIRDDHQANDGRGGEEIEGTFVGFKRVAGLADESTSEVLIDVPQNEEKTEFKREEIPVFLIASHEVVHAEKDR